MESRERGNLRGASRQRQRPYLSYLHVMLSNLMGPQAVLTLTTIAAILLFIYFIGRSPRA